MVTLKTLFFLVSMTFAASKEPEASFRWMSERSENGIQMLAMQLPLSDQEDVAILETYNPIPIEVDESRSEVDSCIFKGYLKDDPSSKLVITGGCPGSNNFEISIISRRLAKNFRYQVVDGHALEIPNEFGKPITLKDGTNRIFRDIAVPSPQHDAVMQRMREGLTSRALPSAGFTYDIAIIFDATWTSKYGSVAEGINAVRRVIAQAQIVYYWASLTVPVTLNIVSISNTSSVSLAASETGLDNLAQFATDSAVMSYLGLSNDGPYGGIAYQPGVCGSLQFRTACARTGSWSDTYTGQIIAHELGHQLGMPHDFIDPYTNPKTVRKDSTGASCTDTGGVMDYFVTVTKWTRCSVEGFTSLNDFYVSTRGSFCLRTGANNTVVNGNWGDWSAFGPCSVSCGGGTQTRSRLCNNPAPANGGATCPGSATDSQACNTQSCCTCPVNGAWGDWGAWGTCSKTCGGGTQTRQRSCNNPAPQNGGNTCPGSNIDNPQACNTQACPNGRIFNICEGKTATLSCTDPTQRMTVVSAFFGRKSGTVCCCAADNNCSLDITDKVRALCQGQLKCDVSASNYPDPCFGIYKYVEVVLGCK